MAATEWTHIRVRKSTKAALDQFVADLEQLLETDPTAAELGRWDKVTVDQAIRVLLNRVKAHRERAKKGRSGSDRRKTKTADPVSGTVDHTDAIAEDSILGRRA